MNRETDIAYAAGFFDGEGAIMVTFDKYLRIEVSVSQKHPEVLRWFHRAFGGNVYLPEGHAGQWKVYGSKSIVFLMTIQPYLIEKAADAQEAINVWKNKESSTEIRRLINERANRRAARG